MLAARVRAAMRCEECAGAEDQHPVDLRPKWERHKYSQVCQMFTWGGECPHQAGGKVCNYAHSVEQLRQGVASCQYGAGCNRRGITATRPCPRLHPGETIEELVARQHLIVPLPLVCEKIVPVPKWIDHERMKAEENNEKVLNKLGEIAASKNDTKYIDWVIKRQEDQAKLLGESRRMLNKLAAYCVGGVWMPKDEPELTSSLLVKDEVVQNITQMIGPDDNTRAPTDHLKIDIGACTPTTAPGSA